MPAVLTNSPLPTSAQQRFLRPHPETPETLFIHCACVLQHSRNNAYRQLPATAPSSSCSCVSWSSSWTMCYTYLACRRCTCTIHSHSGGRCVVMLSRASRRSVHSSSFFNSKQSVVRSQPQVRRGIPPLQTAWVCLGAWGHRRHTWTAGSEAAALIQSKSANKNACCCFVTSPSGSYNIDHFVHERGTLPC